MIINFGLTGVYFLLKFKHFRGGCLFSDCALSELSDDFGSQNFSGLLALVNVFLLLFVKNIFFCYINEAYNGENTLASASHFTILMKIPTNRTRDSNESLKSLINKILSSEYMVHEIDKVEIANVVPIYDVSEIAKVSRQILKLSQTIQVKRHMKMSTAKEESKIEVLKEEHSSILINFQKNNADAFTGWVLVTFQTENEMRKVLARSESCLSRLGFNKFGHPRKYQIYQAPEPSDIIWTNFGISWKQNLVKRVFILFMVCLVLGISFGLLFGLKNAQSKANQKSDDLSGIRTVLGYVTSVVTGLIIWITNALLCKVLNTSTYHETFTTHSDFFAGVISKVSLAKFLNTAIVILIVTGIFKKNGDWMVFNQEGLACYIFIIMITALFADIFSWLFDVDYLRKLYRRRKIKSRLNSSLQCEATEAYEEPVFQISEAYIVVFKVLSFALFYQFFLPYGLLLAMLELALIFIVCKYVLVRRSSKPIDMNFLPTKKLIRNFETSIFILSLGYFTFEVIVKKATVPLSPFSIAALCLGGLEFLFGINLSFFCLSCLRSKQRERTFSELKPTLAHDYDRSYPITVREAIEKR